MKIVCFKAIKRVNNKRKKKIRMEKIKLGRKMMEKKERKVKMEVILKNKKLQKKQ